MELVHLPTLRQALRIAIENATPGEWLATEQRGREGHGWNAQVFAPGTHGQSLATLDFPNGTANAKLMALACPPNMGVLLDHIDRVERLNDAAGDRLHEVTATANKWIRLLEEAERLLKEATGDADWLERRRVFLEQRSLS